MPLPLATVVGVALTTEEEEAGEVRVLKALGIKMDVVLKGTVRMVAHRTEEGTVARRAEVRQTDIVHTYICFDQLSRKQCGCMWLCE